MRLSKHSTTFKAITLALLVAALAAIWLLTVQTPNETMRLSGWWSNFLASTGLVSAPQSSFIMRKVAHTAEFLPVGVLAALCALAWFSDKWSRKKLVVCATLFCVACSLTDQTHKLFVPGREFDCRDVACDAVGYLLGIAVVFVVATLRKSHKSDAEDSCCNGLSSDLSNPDGFSAETLKAMDDAVEGRTPESFKSNKDMWSSIFNDKS